MSRDIYGEWERARIYLGGFEQEVRDLMPKHLGDLAHGHPIEVTFEQLETLEEHAAAESSALAAMEEMMIQADRYRRAVHLLDSLVRRRLTRATTIQLELEEILEEVGDY